MKMPGAATATTQIPSSSRFLLIPVVAKTLQQRND
jgi:hypothetical protein